MLKKSSNPISKYGLTNSLRGLLKVKKQQNLREKGDQDETHKRRADNEHES